MERQIFITGATGKVGQQLVKTLQSTGASIRAAAHDPAKADSIAGPNTQIVSFDFDRRETVEAALEGIDTLVLITPPDARQVDWAVQTIDLAKAAGVRRVIRMSVLAAAMEPGIRLGRWHRTVERYLIGSGLQWTIVRPGPFMQNFLGMYPATENGFSLPVGDAPVNHIHTGDVALALAAVVGSDDHNGRIYMVTGGEALGLAETTARLAKGQGRQLTYQSVSSQKAREAFLKSGRPAWLVDVLLELFAAFGTGAVGLRTSTFEELTGRLPRSIASFAEETGFSAAA